ncbi:chromatin assembly factor 1 subunit B [Trichoplusia ni]|uniref:Chromatin assembly factor 1 subunit B n=1 Tax=Trichoplusia ni TaxID=7111 RepID=A0A7E5VXY1_TRINI|nr:chromatin assembly factor 1 subunit B [Trichoplusia ni]
MKFAIPEISWHNRDPVLSVDFQPKADTNEALRLATGGTDSHVLIWYISTTDSGSVNLEVAADLTRHQKAVNVVRWSPNGQYLASGDDESIIFIWKKTDKEPAPAMEQMEEQYKESWVIHKTLRGHMEDVLDISWSANSLHLASGSVDNKLLVWDLARGKYSSILTDHKGFVQGVSWDPRGQMIASASSDRVMRTFDVASKKVTSRSSKAVLPFPAEHPLHDVKVRLYHDDTLQTYYRRLQFSPDGLLLAVPGGKIEPEQGKVDIKPINAVYIYTRYSLKVPACVLPCGEPALVCRWSGRRYRLRGPGPAPALPAPGPAPAPPATTPACRMLLAVATKRSVLLYDTQQKTPIALINNIHYTRLTDLSWSPDGQQLVASSTDGYCSVISFAPGELGEVIPDDEPAPEQHATESMEVDEQPADTPKEEPEKPKETKPVNKIDSFIKFKAPEKSPKKQKIEPQQKTPIKIDVLEEVAMPSWSDNSNNEIIKPKAPEPSKDEVMVIEDSEDIKLIYEDTEGAKSTSQSPDSPKNKNTVNKPTEKSETKDTAKTDEKTSKQNNSPKSPPNTKSNVSHPSTPKSSGTINVNSDNNFFKQAKVTDVKEQAVKSAPSPKAPRRVSFVTLSSPKNAKKK